MNNKYVISMTRRHSVDWRNVCIVDNFTIADDIVTRLNNCDESVSELFNRMGSSGKMSDYVFGCEPVGYINGYV